MRKILIVGAGQAGLQLAPRPAAGRGIRGDRDEPAPEAARYATAGSPRLSACSGAALDLERRALAWIWACPESGHRIDGLGVSVPGPDAAAAVNWLGRLSQYAHPSTSA